MLHRLSVSSSRRGVVFRLILLLIVGAFIADCQDAERSVAPAAGGPQLSLLAAQGLKGTIAFHSSRSGDFDIYTMNADGTGVTQLTNNAFPEFDPIWSPDGKRLAFGRYDGVDFEVVVINADGSGETLLTPTISSTISQTHGRPTASGWRSTATATATPTSTS